VLKYRSRVRPPDHVQDVVYDLFVVPAGGELRLAWLADSVSVTAATARLTVEYVRRPLRRDVDILCLRPVRGIDRIPSRTIRVDRPAAVSSRLAVRGRPKHLVVLRATARLGRLDWLGPRGRNVAGRTFPLRRAEVIVRPV
jgi:hypothetical protein